jgi:hypothetical protein
MSTILLILGCYGITMLIVQSKIMEPLRLSFTDDSLFHYMLNCMMCMGFWVGLFFTTYFKYSFSLLFFHQKNMVFFDDVIYRIFDASLISASIWFLYLIQLNLEKYVEDKL